MKFPFHSLNLGVLAVAALMSLPVSAQFRADGYKPGEQSVPLDVPVRPGGIDANQLAANNDVLNRTLSSAIEAGNVEGVRQALKAGVSLQFDFATVCTGWNGLRMLSGVRDYTFSSADVGSPEKLRMNNIQSLSVINNGGTSEVQVPTFCHKAHMLQAIRAVITSENIATSTPMRMLPTYDMESLQFLFTQNLQNNRSDERFAKSELEERASRRQKMLDRLEIIELIDANVPMAQKRWYASYARNLTYIPTLQNWLMVKYQEATAKLEEAQAYDEPNHVAWDKLVVKSLKEHIDKTPPTVFGRSTFTTIAITNGKSARALHELTDIDRLVRIDHALVNLEYGSGIQAKLHQDMYCKAVNEVARIEELGRKRTRAPEEAALIPVFEKYLTDDVRWFETANLSALRYDQIVNDISRLPVSLRDKVQIYDAVMVKRLQQRQASAWVNEPEFSKLIADPLFHGNSQFLMTGTGRAYFENHMPNKPFSAPYVRALLASGFDAKKLYPNEKAPIDIVAALRMPEREAPYLDAQFSQTDCKYLTLK
jgi:hypothetical protein